MPRPHARPLATLIAALALTSTSWTAAPSTSQGLPVPAGWLWITDAPVEHQTMLDPPAGRWLFGEMAPGWHITTRPGVLVYEPAAQPAGRFSVELEVFLFPGTSAGGLGVFLGGANLQAASRRHTAFLIRRDGHAAVIRTDGQATTAVRDWMRAPGALPGQASDAVRNVLRVDVELGRARFSVNGQPAAEVAAEPSGLAGLAGLRLGADLNVHVTNFDITHRLAPVRARP